MSGLSHQIRRQVLLIGIFLVLGCSGGIESEMAFIKDVADLTAFWFIDPKDQQFFALLEENFRGFEDYDLIPVLIHQRQRLATALMTL